MESKQPAVLLSEERQLLTKIGSIEGEVSRVLNALRAELAETQSQLAAYKGRSQQLEEQLDAAILATRQPEAKVPGRAADDKLQAGDAAEEGGNLRTRAELQKENDELAMRVQSLALKLALMRTEKAAALNAVTAERQAQPEMKAATEFCSAQVSVTHPRKQAQTVTFAQWNVQMFSFFLPLT